MKALIGMQHAAGPAEVGAKGWALARARRAGLPVPDWFALSPSAWRADGRLADGARAELAAALAALCPRGEPVAVRNNFV